MDKRSIKIGVGYLLTLLFVNTGWSDEVDSDRCFEEICPNGICGYESTDNQSVFSIQGNNLVDEHRLARIITSVLLDYPTLMNAELARRKVSEYYACLGYINSGAILKTDDNGHFVYQIIEGVIDRADVLIKGDVTSADKAYIRQVMLSGQERDTLNIHHIRHRLVRLKHSDRYGAIQADISPKSLGEAYLTLNLNRKSNPFSGQISVDNNQSTLVGRERIGFDLAYYGFDDPAHALSVSGSVSEGLTSVSAAYRLSDYYGDYLNVALSHSESIIIQAPLDTLDIKSTSNKLSFSGHLNWWRNTATGRYGGESSRNTSLSSLLIVELQENQNTLLGRHFSFSAAEVDGRSKLGSIKAQLDWGRKSRDSAYSMSHHFEVGKDLSGASSLSEYALLGGSTGYKGAIDDNTQFILRGLYQWANEGLPSAKKMGLGGAVNLRGVANNSLFTDSALFVSAQIDHKLGVFSPWPAVGIQDGQYHLSTFIDHGLGVDHDGDNANKHLTSAGLGLRWQLNKNWLADVSWGTVIDSDFSVRDGDQFYFKFVRRFGE